MRLQARGTALWHCSVRGARWLLPSPAAGNRVPLPKHTLSLGEAGQPALHGNTVVLGELLLPGSGRWALPHPELRTRGGIPGSPPAGGRSGLGISHRFSSTRPSGSAGVPCASGAPGATSGISQRAGAAQQSSCLGNRVLPF